MEKKIKQVPRFVQVQDGYEEKTVYVTCNGKTFDSEEAALKYEAIHISRAAYEKKFKLERVTIGSETYDAFWVDDISKQTKNQICAYYSKLRPDDIGHLVVGLNLLEVDESGDYTRYYLYDPKEMISDLEEELSQLKQLTTKHL
jgi:hypothetical protein